MYRRVLLTLYAGGRGRTAGALTASRYTDHILKCFSLGSVHSSEKKPPEVHIGSDPAAEGKKPPEVHIGSDPAAEGKKPPEVHISSDPAAEGKKPPEKHVGSDPAAEGKKPNEKHVGSDPAAEGKKPPEKHVGSDTAAEGKKPPEKHVGSDPAAEGKKPPEKHVGSDPAAEGKKPPEKHVGSDTAAEGKIPPEKHVRSDPPSKGKMDMPHKEETSQKPKDTLINVIKGMKVEVSAKNRLQPKKHWKKEHLMVKENMEGLESSSKLFQMASKANQPKEEKEVSPEMEAAVSAVASTFPNKKNQVESELLRQLRLHKQMAETQRKEGMNISDVLSGMQIKSSKDIRKESVQQHARVKQPKKNSLRLFAGKRLRMFPAPPVSEQTTVTESSPTLWDIELAKAVAAACEQPPRNGFEEMIQWTNEGKLWTFPINNEAGFVEEQNVEFHEHIFLDKYLEDFPKQGPIRHFIELVACGLSKNPYLTVQQKKEHIDWFRDYFNQKEDILRECEVYLN